MNNTNPLLQFENQWVAMTPNKRRVVAAAKKLSNLEKKIENMKKRLLIVKVLPFDASLAP